MRLRVKGVWDVNLDGPWSSQPDRVEDLRLIVIRGGRGLWTVNRDHFLVQPQEVLFFRAGQVRYAAMVPGEPVSYWALRFELMDEPEPEPPWLVLPTRLRLSNDEYARVDRTIARIRHELNRRDLHYLDATDALARSLFIALARADWRVKDEAAPDSGHRRPGDPGRLLDHAIQYVLDHIAEPIAVADLAAVCGYSPSHLRRIFLRWTGLSPQAYILRTRLWRAQELLSGGSYSIKEVAKFVGYDDSLYFSRLFRRHAGVPPTHYRARARSAALVPKPNARHSER